MTQPDKEPLPWGLSSVDCVVIVRDGSDHIIVRDENGQRHNLPTALPDVNVGHKGRIVTMGEITAFIREPYS